MIAAVVCLALQLIDTFTQGSRRIGFSNHDLLTTAQYTRLLPRYLLSAVSQPILMIQVDAAYYRYRRVNDVNSIQAAAQPNFKNNHIDLP